VLRVKLRYLDDWNAARREHAAAYSDALHDVVDVPSVHPDAEPVWHLYVIRTPERERLQRALKERGVATGVHYPIPLHLQPAYAYLELPKGTLPVTEQAAAEILSLPMYAELTEEQLTRVVESVRAAAWRGTDG
jgi:dTDP-4-amino-4,6-dideoxygalactose transaminase